MKIDRLLGIVIYLLNHNTVSATILAKKFEVSTRTIQRDIESLCLAGIPIISLHGVNGGYSIEDTFRLEKQITSSEDYQYITTALEGMKSAYRNDKLEDTLEKLLSITKRNVDIKPQIKLDLSTSREGNYVDEYVKIIDNAIKEERIIEFKYTNSYGDKSLKLVEPLAIIFKWYSWYMFGYSRDKKDYRLYKLVRMRNLKEITGFFSIKHENINKLLEEYEKQDNRIYMDVKILCKKEIRVSIEEYFPKGNIEELENKDFILSFRIPSTEIGWKGILLSYSNKIKILEPEELRDEFIIKAKEIIGVYE
ncbi:helix-turn-helix transcriptional regulator [Clostridium sp. 'White wine YQ']|uniref:helix-turn-helix transcriptional regulator n=1 Tax=Clostridium sp. 'White wine YQ' TaxID=3027474 RepID=UPI00236528EB|nr:YafY family protein [Clostridium sp. 'White wine YQ']MDD7794443.1 YafY family protein [Clostridium sp. 'White wine YQ']